jgi:hypothetical protein
MVNCVIFSRSAKSYNKILILIKKTCILSGAVAFLYGNTALASNAKLCQGAHTLRSIEQCAKQHCHASRACTANLVHKINAHHYMVMNKRAEAMASDPSVSESQLAGFRARMAAQQRRTKVEMNHVSKAVKLYMVQRSKLEDRYRQDEKKVYVAQQKYADWREQLSADQEVRKAALNKLNDATDALKNADDEVANTKYGTWQRSDAESALRKSQAAERAASQSFNTAFQAVNAADKALTMSGVALDGANVKLASSKADFDGVSGKVSQALVVYATRENQHKEAIIKWNIYNQALKHRKEADRAAAQARMREQGVKSRQLIDQKDTRLKDLLDD